jgi:hypothetical protein
VTAAGDEPNRTAAAHGVSRPLYRRPASTVENRCEAGARDGLASLQQMVEAASAALEQVAHIGGDVRLRQQQLRVAEQHLDAIGQLLDRARREPTAVAGEVVRASLPEGACGVAWPVCSHCLGVGVASSAGSSWCPSCGRPGPPGSARPTYLCTERATVTVRDATGAEEAMCLSHAAGALRRVDRLTVARAEEDEVRRLVAARDRPLRVDLARPVTRPEPDRVRRWT